MGRRWPKDLAVSYGISSIVQLYENETQVRV